MLRRKLSSAFVGGSRLVLQCGCFQGSPRRSHSAQVGRDEQGADMPGAAGDGVLSSRNSKCRCPERGKNLACSRNRMSWRQGEGYRLCGPHRNSDNNSDNCCYILGPPSFHYINLHSNPFYR